MKIVVTEDEVLETAKLLELMSRWKKLANIRQDHWGGHVQLKVNTEGIICSVDSHAIRNTHNGGLISAVDIEIREMIAAEAESMANAAIDIIRKHLPIPIEE